MQLEFLLFNVLLQLSFLTLPKSLLHLETSGWKQGRTENQYL